MPKEEILEFSGIVYELLPNANFRVRLVPDEDNASADSEDIDVLLRSGDSVVLAYTSGRMRKNRIRISVGDKVKLAMNPCDMTRARITYRFK
ncbi:MAG: translation initiation factor IF-1 [Candidatus Liberibacter ctenarytainae]|uniref:Translation initiation factor IF-1 n=1 Tax=Candidatus Liberibacter ctenarytainae TaxID=2020335 RepID=A0A937AEA5_9HYPH|nr:translation initiation factor IF-1 [Candidatus Liberibacter ctenarytainae]